MVKRKVIIRPTIDQWGIQLAYTIATRSTCYRRSVGCVLLDKYHHIIGTGYNGVCQGAKHCNGSTGFKFLYDNGIDKSKPLTGQSTGEELIYGNTCDGAFSKSGTDLDKCKAIHAEQNALLQCQDVNSILTCYTTTAPCITCVKLLLNTACRNIVFAEDYPHTEPKELWEGAERSWYKLAASRPHIDVTV